MAVQEASPAPAPSAQVVGNAFVEQYYRILHQSPSLVHRFYHDSSFLSRADGNGVMTTVTTTQAINEKILSLNYEDYTAEIKTSDAQESYGKGVIVLVTGSLTGKDDVRRKFSQTFFLAPQDKGYYVLNDVFRFVEESNTSQSNSVPVNVINENAEAAPLPETDVIHTPEHHVADPPTSAEGKHLNNGAEGCDPLDNEEEGSVIDEEVVEPTTNLNQNNNIESGDSVPLVEDDAPRKSYASIVRKSYAASGPVYVPSRTAKVTSANTVGQLPPTAKYISAPEAVSSISENVPGSSDIHEEAEGHSIYVRNLPFNATVEQLEEVFKKFGSIKHDGIQVRSSKRGFCFGFVEFEELSSRQSALEASPITVGDRQAVIEEKRTTTRVSGSGRGRYSSGRSGFRNESFRNRWKYGGGRGYGRNEFRSQGELSGRPKGSAGQKGDSSQRVSQNGGARYGRQAKHFGEERNW
ncbi:hypothetical protein L6164_011256 [Bauhinia variegata]|uniref:Uncharacterized protein n=1 Tax=Bauhinia variegata TaxID=167791 RepID=A0ACB9P5C5_BAUVA|nr:hypothetical protein L6164_011256 [Bauhinia variegata]